MRVLVTGGGGFIGSHVVDDLLRVGHEVTVLDTFGPPSHDGFKPSWLDTRAKVMHGDVRRKEDWKRALHDVDAVIHLAAYMDYHLDFSNYVDTNILSIALMFECINEGSLPIKKIIAASSQSVYGVGKYRDATCGVVYPPSRSEDDLKVEKWEHYCDSCSSPMEAVEQYEDDVLTPITPYGISKLSSEHFLTNLGREFDIPTTALRYSIVLGPRQSFRHFYSGALRAFSVYALNDVPIHMNEDGNQLRDFVHVKDVARAHTLLLDHPGAAYQAFNVGYGSSTRVKDLAKMVARAAGKEYQPHTSGRYRVGDGRHARMNVDKLKAMGWSPQHSVQDAVSEYIEWIRQFGDLSEILSKSDRELEKKGILKSK